MAADSGFEIDGTTYEVPSLDTFNMDESQVLFDYAKLALEDFVDPHPDLTETEKEAFLAERAEKLKNPALLRSLAHVAYQRGNPDVKAADVRVLMGKQNSVSILADFLAGGEGDDSLPPVSTTEPEQPSPSEVVSNTSSSGERSPNGLGALDEVLGSTTDGKSGTSSTSAPKLSAA